MRGGLPHANRGRAHHLIGSHERRETLAPGVSSTARASLGCGKAVVLAGCAICRGRVCRPHVADWERLGVSGRDREIARYAALGIPNDRCRHNLSPWSPHTSLPYTAVYCSARVARSRVDLVAADARSSGYSAVRPTRRCCEQTGVKLTAEGELTISQGPNSQLT